MISSSPTYQEPANDVSSHPMPISTVIHSNAIFTLNVRKVQSNTMIALESRVVPIRLTRRIIPRHCIVHVIRHSAYTRFDFRSSANRSLDKIRRIVQNQTKLCALSRVESMPLRTTTQTASPVISNASHHFCPFNISLCHSRHSLANNSSSTITR